MKLCCKEVIVKSYFLLSILKTESVTGSVQNCPHVGFIKSGMPTKKFRAMTMQGFISNETVLQGSNCQIWFPSIHDTQGRIFFDIINIQNGVIEGKDLFELLSTGVHRKTWDGNMLRLLKQEENGPRDVFRVEDVSGHSRHGSLPFLDSSKVLA